MIRGHAARVDTRRQPLRVALRYGCAGLTVGVHVDERGRLAVYGRDQPDRTLRALVLDPLAARVAARGCVYPAQRLPFTVVLEAAGGTEPAGLLNLLDDELAGHASMLAACVAGRVRPGPVLVVLSRVPRRALDARPHRLYFGECSLADVERGIPATALPVAGEHVAWRLGWDGHGEIPPEERQLLRALVRAAHGEGKRVRFFGVPESRRAVRLAFWRELHAAGADLISARDLGALRRFLGSVA
jgi:hypothetical protein